MSTAPAPASDNELRLKRSALAWEIRKYRLEARSRAALEQQRLALEQRKFENESSFWHRLGPTLVTSVTAVLGALIGFFGVAYNISSTQQTNERNSAAGAFIATLDQRKQEASDQIEERAKILASKSPDLAAEIFRRLANQSATSSGRTIWDQGIQVASSPANAAPPSFSGTVYVHYKDPTNSAAVDAVIAALTKAGYYVPGKQNVVQDTDGDVRYYAAPQDTATKSTAENIANLVQQALAASGVPHAIQTKDLHATYPKVPATTFEVWLPALASAPAAARN